MRCVKRGLCLLLAVMLLAGLLPPETDAAGGAIFTSANDTLLPLSDETMPFYSGGVLYVASMAFDGTDLGIYYSRSRDKMTASLYKKRNIIIFDLAAGTIETNNGTSYSGSAITRGDIVFLPLDVMCRYFNLEYSYTSISYGYLLRIKSESVVLSDAVFIDAADTVMAQRYARYERAKTEQQEQTPAPVDNPKPQEQAQRTAYFVIECTDPARTEQLLTRFSGGRATYLFAPDNIRGADELLRCLAAGGGAIALRIDASGGAENAVSQIDAGNRALWEAANVKTRLIWLDNASEETVRRVTEAGYCPFGAALNLGGSGLSVSRMSARILAAADARKGSCRVFLGTDESVSGSLGTLLTMLGAGNCTPARLNEVTVSK